MSNSIQGSIATTNHLTGEIKSSGGISGNLHSSGKVGGSLQVAMLKGDKGDKGDVGEKGEKGDKGDKGDSATIAIGSVTTGSEVSITNNGDEHDAVFDFVFPKVSEATEEVAGVTKLYNATGENIDGGMTQKAITHTIEDSVSSR